MKRFSVFSIRTKLLFFAAMLIVIPGGIYGAVTLANSRAALAHVIGRHLVEEARSSVDRLSTVLRSEQERLASLAMQDVMREIRIEDFDKRISSFLTSVKRGCSACVDLFVLNREEHVVASSNPLSLGKRGEGILGADSSEKTIDGPLPADREDALMLRFSVPVPDPDAPQMRIGRLVALLDWEHATGVVTRVRENLVSVGLQVDVLILDQRRVVIGGATQTRETWPRGQVVALQLANLASRTELGYLDSTAEMLIGYASLPNDLPPWAIVVAEPFSEAFAPVRRAVALLAVILVGALLLALVTALIAADRVTRPLVELTQVAEVVGRGQRLTSVVPVRSRDEIGTLTAAFNRMATDLQRAEQELVEAAKFSFVGELAAGVAHEVRTPLGVLRSAAQLLERSLEVNDDESRELLRLLPEEVDRIERVVSALLDLGRPRELRLEPSALGQIVLRAADFIEPQARQKQIAIRRRVSDHDLVVLCDPELIYQVALNLLVNAVQLLFNGGILEIALLPVRNGYAGFEVRDDGPGMTEDVRTRIFEPFFTRREGGTGLGLTFVQRVIQEHGGRVFVESELGCGAVFRILLPVAEVFS